MSDLLMLTDYLNRAKVTSCHIPKMSAIQQRNADEQVERYRRQAAAYSYDPRPVGEHMFIGREVNTISADKPRITYWLGDWQARYLEIGTVYHRQYVDRAYANRTMQNWVELLAIEPTKTRPSQPVQPGTVVTDRHNRRFNVIDENWTTGQITLIGAAGEPGSIEVVSRYQFNHHFTPI